MSCVPPCSAITILAAALLAGSSVPALAQSDAPPAAAESDHSATIADLQRQIDELKATVRALQAALSGSSPAPVAVPPAAPQAATSPAIPATPTLALAQAPQASDPVTVSTAPKSKAW